MTKRYTMAEARADFAAVVDAAETESVEVTNHGRPVAIVLSVATYERLKRPRPSFAEFLETFRAQHDAETEGIEPGYFESLRDKSPGREPDFGD